MSAATVCCSISVIFGIFVLVVGLTAFVKTRRRGITIRQRCDTGEIDCDDDESNMALSFSTNTWDSPGPLPHLPTPTQPTTNPPTAHNLHPSVNHSITAASTKDGRQCDWGMALEFVWVRYAEKPEDCGYFLDVARRTSIPLTVYQVVDSGQFRSTRYRSPPNYRDCAQKVFEESLINPCVRLRYAANRGDEATAYLSFIIERYSTLPRWTLFVNGDLDHHRQRRFLACLKESHGLPRQEESDAERALPGMMSIGGKYKAGRDNHNTNGLELGYEKLWRDWKAHRVLPRHMPKSPAGIARVSLYCCANFIVARQAITSCSKLFYEIALNDALVEAGATMGSPEAKALRHDIAQSVIWAGQSFEHIWHVIFGRPALASQWPKSAVKMPAVFNHMTRDTDRGAWVSWKC